jgi:hypothetical protein
VTALTQKIDELKRTAISALSHSKSRTEDNNILDDLLYAGIEEALKMEPSEVLHHAMYGCWTRLEPTTAENRWDAVVEMYLAMRAGQWKEIEEGRR